LGGSALFVAVSFLSLASGMLIAVVMSDQRRTDR
jgi:hypothetical protein